MHVTLRKADECLDPETRGRCERTRAAFGASAKMVGLAVGGVAVLVMSDSFGLLGNFGAPLVG